MLNLKKGNILKLQVILLIIGIIFISFKLFLFNKRSVLQPNPLPFSKLLELAVCKNCEFHILQSEAFNLEDIWCSARCRIEFRRSIKFANIKSVDTLIFNSKNPFPADSSNSKYYTTRSDLRKVYEKELFNNGFEIVKENEIYMDDYFRNPTFFSLKGSLNVRIKVLSEYFEDRDRFQIFLRCYKDD